jgi:hypothetical protein
MPLAHFFSGKSAVVDQATQHAKQIRKTPHLVEDHPLSCKT